MMPSNPTADLVVIEAYLAIAGREHLFDPVPLPLGTDHCGQGDLRAGVRQGVVDLCLTHRSDHDQPLFRPDPTVLLGPDLDRHRVDQKRPFLTVADGDPLPPRLRLALCPILGPLKRDFALPTATGMSAPGAALSQVAHRRVAGHVQDISLVPRPQRRTERCWSSEFIVADDPTMRQTGQAPAQKVERDLPLLLELDLSRDVALLASGLVGSPVLGQVEPPIQGAVAGGGRVCQEDTDLAVVDLAQSAAPLAVDPTGLRPFLGERAGVDHHNAVGFTQRLAYMIAQLFHHSFVIPLARSDEGLDRLAVQSRLDRDRFAGLALQAAETATDDDGGIRAMLGPIESRGV